MNPFQWYCEKCQHSEYAEAFNTANTIWRKHLWNPTDTRNKILAIVKKHYTDLACGNPLVHSFEWSSLCDRIRAFSYTTEPTRIDNVSKKMLFTAIKLVSNSNHLIGKPWFSFSLRRPIESIRNFGKPIEPDYYMLTIHLSDAHVNMIERIAGKPGSMYHDQYEGIADCDFTIDLYSDITKQCIATLEFPYRTIIMECDRKFTDNSELALILRETCGNYDHMHRKFLLCADAICTPINVWVASLSESVLKMEDEFLPKLETYVNTDHTVRTEEGNQMNAWSSNILASHA